MTKCYTKPVILNSSPVQMSWRGFRKYQCQSLTPNFNWLGVGIRHLYLKLPSLFWLGRSILLVLKPLESLESLLKHRFLGPTLRGFDSVDLKWDKECALLTSSQAILMMLVSDCFEEDHLYILMIHIQVSLTACSSQGSPEKQTNRMCVHSKRERGFLKRIGWWHCADVEQPRRTEWLLGWRHREELQFEAKGSLLREFLLLQRKSVFFY